MVADGLDDNKSYAGWRTVLRLLPFVHPFKTQIVLSLGCTVLMAAAGLVLPFISGHIIDALVKGNTGAALALTGVSLLGEILTNALSFLQYFYSSLVTSGFGRDLSIAMFSRLQFAPVSYFVRHPSGEITNRIRGDVDNFAQILYSSVFPFISSIVSLALTAGAMFTTNWPLALAGCIAIPLWILTSRPATASLSILRSGLSRAMDAHHSTVNEVMSLSGAVRMKSYGAFATDLARYENATQALYNLSREFVLNSGFQTVIGGAAAAVGPAAVLSVGAVLVSHHQATVGLLVTFLALQGRLRYPIESIVRLKVQLPALNALAERIQETFDEVPEKTGSRECEPVIESLEIDDVCFSYGDADVLEHASLSLRRAEHVCLMAHSGRGKTTLLHLILGFYQARNGRIMLNGRDVRHFDLMSLRNSITFVAQGDSIISGTIADNLRYGAPMASDNELWEALSVVQLRDFVAAQPEGLEYNVGVQGAVLSGGQRQRLAIARALLRPRPVMVFDEATSAVDVETERKVMSAIRERLRDKMMLVITHRPNLARMFDRCVALDSTQRERGIEPVVREAQYAD